MENQLDCTGFVLKVGLKQAVEILGDQVLQMAKLTFEQWVQEYSRESNKKLQSEILTKITQIASTPDQWLRVWYVATANNVALRNTMHGSLVEKFVEFLNALTTFDQVLNSWPRELKFDFGGRDKVLNVLWLERLVELACSVEQWHRVRFTAHSVQLGDNDVVAKSLVGMEKHAVTAKDWELLYHEAPDGSQTRKRALFNLARFAKSYSEWSTIWYRARGKDDHLEKVAWLELVARATTFAEWFSILAHDKDDASAQEVCLNKLFGLAKTFKDWISIYQSSTDKMKEYALVQALAMASTLDDWLTVLRWTPDGSADKANALKQVRSFVNLG